MSTAFSSAAVFFLSCEWRRGEHVQDYLCSFMPHCTPSDDPDADFSLRGGADQAAHL